MKQTATHKVKAWVADGHTNVQHHHSFIYPLRNALCGDHNPIHDPVLQNKIINHIHYKGILMHVF